VEKLKHIKDAVQPSSIEVEIPPLLSLSLRNLRQKIADFQVSACDNFGS
jgi:hypothetical protein